MNIEKEIRQISLVGDKEFLHRLQLFVRLDILTPANLAAVHM
jgi:hypothetical protein